MYINILFQLASSLLKGFYCCKSKRNLSVRAKRETRIGKLGRFQGFRVSGFQPWREQKFKSLYNRKHLKSQKAEHSSADGRGGNLALPLKAELFGRVNGQQLIKQFCSVLCKWKLGQIDLVVS